MYKNLDAVAGANNSSAGEVEMGRSLELAGQPVLVSGTGSVRNSVSKNKAESN